MQEEAEADADADAEASGLVWRYVQQFTFVPFIDSITYVSFTQMHGELVNSCQIKITFNHKQPQKSLGDTVFELCLS